MTTKTQLSVLTQLRDKKILLEKMQPKSEVESALTVLLGELIEILIEQSTVIRGGADDGK